MTAAIVQFLFQNELIYFVFIEIVIILSLLIKQQKSSLYHTIYRFEQITPKSNRKQR